VTVYVEVGHIAVQLLANIVGEPTDCEDVSRAVEGHTFVEREAFASQNFVRDGAKARVVGFERVAWDWNGHRFDDN
jgi:hypothetical protein